MKQVTFILAFLFIISIVSAAETQVTLIDDIGSFTGAVLRLKSPVTEDLGDKIYASEYLTNVGIVKFNIETALPEVFLNFRISKNGAIVDEFEVGPFSVNNSGILVDRREKVIQEESVEAPSVEENITEDPEEIATEENASDNQEVVIEEPVEENAQRNEMQGFLLTGRAIVENVGMNKIGIGAVALFAFAVAFIFMISKKKKKTNNILSEDDKELAYMEKKVKATESRLSQIKKEREKRQRLEDAKNKLAKEEKELAELEKKERRDAERIEDL